MMLWLLVLLVALCGTARADIVSGPWLQAATTTQMVVMWESSDTAAGSVAYGLTASYGSSVTSTRVTVPATAPTTGTDVAVNLHTVRLTGLAANTLYHYRVTSGAATSVDFTFRTHKTSGTWRFVHMSDAHRFRLTYTKQTRDAIKAYNPDYIINAGDLTEDSLNLHFRDFMQQGATLFNTIVHYSVKGNHDDRTWTTFNSWLYNGQVGAASWGSCFTGDCENFYSFDIGPIHFVGIDDNQRQVDYPAGAVDWITSDLASSTAQWKIVFMKHNPAITWTESGSTNAQFLMPIFTTGGVDLVMTGGNSLGFTNQVNGVWYQHAGMGHGGGNGFFGIEVSAVALNITHYLMDGSANKTYQITATPSGNLAPVAAVSATPTTGNFPLNVTFNGTGSSDSDGTITSYAWTFGDGGTASIVSPSHTYAAAGIYNAVLTVTDDDGASDPAAITITVTDPTPPPVEDASVEIAAEADTYGWAANPTTNYGTDTGLLVRDPVGTAQDRISYIRFDLAPLPAAITIASAVLHLYAVPGSSALPVKVHAVTTPWEELSLTWNARPAPGALLGTMNVLSAGVYYQVDLTSHVQALYTAGTDLNLALLDDTSANLLVRFGSRNGATNHPKLVVTYTGEEEEEPPPPPDPPPGTFPPCPQYDVYRGCTTIVTAHPELNGYFRTEKIGNRWWIITPAGHGFISLGISVLNPNGVDGADRDGHTYEYYAELKYGAFPTNTPAWANATLDKMRALGFNTIGTFSHKIQGLEPTNGVITRLPWVSTLRVTNSVMNDLLVGNVMEGLASGKFPDMYHPGFEAAVIAETNTVLTTPMITDPYILFHFIDQADELRGIGEDHTSLCWAAWVGKPTLAVTGGTAPNHVKQRLRSDMETKYGTIAALNAAWGTSYTSWDSAGGYPNGTGFVDQGPTTAVGATYAQLDLEATPAMVGDCDTFVQDLWTYYATFTTTTVRSRDPNHLISTPNDVSNHEAVKGFDAKFDLLWCEHLYCYDLLTTKMPLASMNFEFITGEMDSPLSLHGAVYSVTEIIGSQIKIWDIEQSHCWMDLSVGNRNRLAFFDETGAIKNYGFLANGNEFNLDANGEDDLGCWFLLSSRGGGTGVITDIDAVSAPLHYRRNGFGNFGPPQTFRGVGYDTQEARAAAWKSGVHGGLREQAANGDYPRVGANWWKWSDNGWTYGLERYNWGLVTQKDNAYNGVEATNAGADGVQGTPDDEEANYGNLWSPLAEANNSVYGVASGEAPPEPPPQARKRGFVW